MVVFSPQSRIDLQNIFDGIAGWKTPKGYFFMHNEGIVNYHNDILKICESLDKLPFHAKAKYSDHIKYGTHVFLYKRNFKTAWYFIYEKADNAVFIEKIISTQSNR